MISKYKKEYVVKSYEVDGHGFLRIVSLMNFLQDVAVENAEFLGFGFEACHQKGVAWVGSNYLLKISRFPKLDEHIIIETWPGEVKLWGAIRDFIIRDTAGNIIIKAISQWVLIDIGRRRPVMLNKYFPQYSLIDERVIAEDFQRVADIENPDSVKDFAVRFDDIDINEHVNNSIYPVWASESVEPSFRLKHIPQELEICFKKEALYGEKVEVWSKFAELTSTHIIKDKNTKAELAECRIVWQNITSD